MIGVARLFMWIGCSSTWAIPCGAGLLRGPRSITDGSGFRRMTTRDMLVDDIHNPLSSGYVSSREEADWGAFRSVSSFRDEMPPTTVITCAVRYGYLAVVKGTTADTSDVRRVTVNGRRARPAGALPNGRSPSTPGPASLSRLRRYPKSCAVTSSRGPTLCGSMCQWRRIDPGSEKSTIACQEYRNVPAIRRG
jgi:hypothetical protein